MKKDNDKSRSESSKYSKITEGSNAIESNGQTDKINYEFSTDKNEELDGIVSLVKNMDLRRNAVFEEKEKTVYKDLRQYVIEQRMDEYFRI